MKNIVRIACLFIAILMLLPIIAFADSPYRSYNYTINGTAVPSPDGYKAVATYNGRELGVGLLNAPKDMAFDKNGNLYILDSGNNRLLILDKNLKPVDEIKRFIDYSSGNYIDISKAEGIFVSDIGEIYIADKGSQAAYRLEIINSKGIAKVKFKKPEHDSISKKLEFQPTKVIVDKNGFVYVVSSGIYQGALLYDHDGNFISFYGANKVTATFQLLQDYFWRQLMGAKASSKIARYVPVEFSNLDIDNNNFIYTVTISTQENQLRKLNTTGVNVLPDTVNGKFGDRERVTNRRIVAETSFVDVIVQDDGYINVLDRTRGRIFQYDKEGNQVFIFGTLGNQKGTFKLATAIEVLNNKIYVLDEEKGSITIFEKTDFGKAVHEALNLYNDGLYEESLPSWQKVVSLNSNYELAYRGLGQAMLKLERYEEAIKYFRLCYDKSLESTAFKNYRDVLIRENFPLIATGAAFLVVLLFLLVSKDGLKSVLKITKLFKKKTAYKGAK